MRLGATRTLLSFHWPAGFSGRGIGGRKHIIERSRLTVRTDLRVGVTVVVYELVLVTDGRVLILEDEVLEAAVAALRNAPLPGELEAVEGGGRDDVALAAGVGAVAWIDGQESVLDPPPRAGCVRLLIAAPPVEGLPVEEQHPAGLLFLSRELIDRVSGCGLLCDGRRRERGRRRNRRDRRRDVVTQVRHGFHPFPMLAGPHPRSLSLGDSAPRSGRRRFQNDKPTNYGPSRPRAARPADRRAGKGTTAASVSSRSTPSPGWSPGYIAPSL